MQVQKISSQNNTQFRGRFLKTAALDNVRTKLAKTPYNPTFRIMENTLNDMRQIRDGRKFLYHSEECGSWISERIGCGKEKKDVPLFFSRKKNDYQRLFSDFCQYYF